MRDLMVRRRAAPVCLMLLLLPWQGALAIDSAATLLWFRDGRATTQAHAVLQQLQAADRDGLDPADYEVAALQGRIARLESLAPAPDLELRAVDAAITGALQRFVTHLHFGRIDPHTAGFRLSHPRTPLEGPDVAARVAASQDAAAEIARLAPPFVHYRLLRTALVHYRQLALRPELTALPPLAEKSVQPGEHYAGATRLRELLQALGDLNEPFAGGDPEVMDAALGGALLRFQIRHGLMPDGVLGNRTLRALRVPLGVRVRQIELTLERWRWLPDVTSPPIIVNIPQFRLFAFRSREDRAADILQIPVIVGRSYPHTRTPVFISELREVVFRPYWDIPASIVRNELLEPIRASPLYLQRHHMEMVRGGGDDAQVVDPTPENLAALAAGRLRLRQRPGADNALGLIKFVMPNDYQVYLHDTPAQQLFLQPQRAFSHGCIRVGDPVALAVHILGANGADWSAEAIRAAMQGADAQRVTLKQPVTVMILYGTAMATEDGRVLFFEDIYGHDRRLEGLLSGLKKSTG